MYSNDSIILNSLLRANRHADCRQTVQRDLGVGDEADQVYFAEFGRIVGHRKGSLSRADSKPKDVATNNRGYPGSGEGNWTGITWVSFFNGNLSLLLAVCQNTLAFRSTCDNILVTLGDKGVLLLTNRDPDEAFYSQGRRTGQLVYTDNNRGPRGLFYAMEDNGGELLAEDIVNVSGAGDSFTSGFIAGMLQGWTANECVWKGMNSACCALKSQSAVPNSYNLTDGARAAKSRILF